MDSIYIARMTKYTLTYFDIEGVADKVRLAFKLNGVDFEDKRISFEEFGALKGSLPLGQLPILEIEGGEVITQSDRMARDAAGSLYPSDAKARSEVDGFIGLAADLQQQITPSMYIGMRPALFGHEDRTPEERTEVIAKLRKNLLAEGSQLRVLLGFLDKQLQKNGTGFAVGDKITLADVYLLPVLRGYASGRYDGIPADFLDSYAGIKKWFETMYANPILKAHYKL